MKQELIRHKKLHLFVLIVIFFGSYALVYGTIQLLNRTINLGAGPIVAQIIFLYGYLMFILRHQLHSFAFILEDGHLIIKDILSKRHKTLLIIPLEQIISVKEVQQHPRHHYNKVLRVKKHRIENSRSFFIEYDDMTDISLVEVTCTGEFMKEVCSHI